MRATYLTAIAVSLCSASLSFAQTAPATAKPPASSLMTLNGCVSSPDGKKSLTLADADLGDTYALSGMNVRDYVGKRVEITGVPNPKKLRVVGGLYPSPNVAAQAGAIDPGRAAIAAQSGPTANTPKPPIDFTVKSVRMMPGDCSPQ